MDRPPLTFELVWGDPQHTVQRVSGPYMVARPEGARDVWVRVETGLGDDVLDPAMLMVPSLYRPTDAWQGDKHLTVRQDSDFVSLADSKSPVNLHYSLRYSRENTFRFPRVRFGSQSVLLRQVVSDGIGAFGVGCLLVALGLAMLVSILMPRATRSYWLLGMFSLPVGMAIGIPVAGLSIPLLNSLVIRDWALALSIGLYPIGLALFVESLFTSGRDWVLRVLCVGVAIVTVACAVMDLARVMHISRVQIGVHPLAFLIIGRTLWLTVRAARYGSQEARIFLMGFLFLAIMGTPEMLYAIFGGAVGARTGYVGLLGFVLAMVVMLERRFSAQSEALQATSAQLASQLRELRKRNKDVQHLNEELQRQVVQRSRELVQALTATTVNTPRIQLGELIDNRYMIERLIGQGGMGSVFEVRRLTDNAQLALKLMTGGSVQDAARFAREAEIAAQLHEPWLVPVRDVGSSGGQLYLVMDLVKGQSLAQSKDRCGDVPWAMRVLAQIAAGLDALHARGIVHRDLKPANVLIEDKSQDRVRITDFGVARYDPSLDAKTPRAVDDTPSELVTRTGALVGTPTYMAPELADPAKGTSPAVDIFAFGVMAYELLTGTNPFALPPIVLSMSGCYHCPTCLAERGISLPPEIVQQLDSSLAADPAGRPTAQDLATSLRPYLPSPAEGKIPVNPVLGA